MKLCNKCGTENTDNSRFCKGCGYELPQTAQTNPTIHPADAKPAKKINKKAILGVVVGVIVASLIAQGISFAGGYFMKSTPVMDKVMMKTAEELNKSCPIMVDEFTKMDNAIALPGKIFQYNYTVFGFTREEVDTIAFKANMEPQIINNIRTNPDMKFIRDNEATLRYYYKGETGAYWFKISVEPKKYKE